MTITSELVGFVLLMCSAAAAAWFRVEASMRALKADMTIAIGAAMSRAELTAAQLHEHKLHVAETYVSKAGLREQTDRIMGAIEAIGGQVKHVSDRLDRFIEGHAPGTRRTTKVD